MHATQVPSVLVVDNDPAITRVMSLRLRHAGYSCVTAASGAEAIDAWRKQQFDVVISDLNMPCGNGIVLAEKLRLSAAVPIIFITGFRGTYAEQTDEIKNVAVIEKPFELKSMLELVGLAVKGKPIGGNTRRIQMDTAGAAGSD
jgi:CheY-like chemotaxis protein